MISPVDFNFYFPMRYQLSVITENTNTETIIINMRIKECAVKLTPKENIVLTAT